MTKLQYTLSSLVAAVPAVLLAWMMTLAFVNHFETMPTAAQVVAGLTLAVCVVLVAIPVYVLFVWSPDATSTGTVEGAESGRSAGFDDDEFAAGEPLVDEEVFEETEDFEEDAEAGEWDEDGDEWDDAGEEWEDEDEPR